MVFWLRSYEMTFFCFAYKVKNYIFALRFPTPISRSVRWTTNLNEIPEDLGVTPLQKRPQVWFELLAEIPVAHELFMKMLPENAKIKKIYRGTLLLVYINTKNSNSLLNKIFHQNLRWWSVSAPIRWIWLKIINKMIFYHILVKNDLKSQYE